MPNHRRYDWSGMETTKSTFIFHRPAPTASASHFTLAHRTGWVAGAEPRHLAETILVALDQDLVRARSGSGQDIADDRMSEVI